MTPGERCLVVAVMALVLGLLCVRVVGEFLAGHAVAVWKRAIRKERKQQRHGKPGTPKK